MAYKQLQFVYTATGLQLAYVGFHSVSDSDVRPRDLSAIPVYLDVDKARRSHFHIPSQVGWRLLLRQPLPLGLRSSA